MLGLCVTPDFYPTSEEQKELNPTAYRSILYYLDDIHKLLNLNKPLFITLNNQCSEVGSDWSGWDNTIFRLCEILKSKTEKIIGIGCGNEFDIYWNENGSVPPEFGADIARRAARIANNYGIKVAATSVAGPRWPEYLTTLADLCRNDVDYFDMHPYGQRPIGWKSGQQWMHGDLETVISDAWGIAQKPIICSEYGVKIQDAGNRIEVANFLEAANYSQEMLGIPHMFWFAYSDLVGAPSERGPSAFGLKSEQDEKRPAWFSYAGLNPIIVEPKPVPEPEPKFNVGRGLLDMMDEDNTQPCMDSEWRPFDREEGVAATIEQCIGLNNVTYCFNINTNSGWRIRPD